ATKHHQQVSSSSHRDPSKILCGDSEFLQSFLHHLCFSKLQLKLTDLRSDVFGLIQCMTVHVRASLLFGSVNFLDVYRIAMFVLRVTVRIPGFLPLGGPHTLALANEVVVRFLFGIEDVGRRKNRSTLGSPKISSRMNKRHLLVR